jgi:cellulose synthase/poly-beta-1,6-N-acetylglucosamine synthase-like glycosyltransferase
MRNRRQLVARLPLWLGLIMPDHVLAESQSSEQSFSALPPLELQHTAAEAFAIHILEIILFLVLTTILVYMLRHLTFTLNRVFGKQRHPYLDVDVAQWPTVTILVPAHNEEKVISHALEALLEVDYPRSRYRIMPVDDRSTDRTQEIIEDYRRQNPNIITPFYRKEGKAGKAAALKDATALIESELLVVFDADYIPGRGLIKQIVSPFFDPEIGAVMGRVVPHNTGSNILTRLLDMERSGGYQVDQQARMNMRLVPQYGGSVGGVRLSALKAVGGWNENALAEDTDLTYRLLLRGYNIAYENRCECYEEVPETWQERNRQIMRWATGHNQAAFKYAWRVVVSPRVSMLERIDGLLLLGVYAVSPLLIIGWICAIALYFLGEQPLPKTSAILLALASFGTIGNFAAFFEIGAAVYLDGGRERIRLLPLNFLNFLTSLISTTRAAIIMPFRKLLLRRLHWHKTQRYRKDD